MSYVIARRFDPAAPERLRCDQRGCRRTTLANDDRFDRGWEVLGTTMDVFDFCSAAHYDAFAATHPELLNQ